MTVRKHAQNFCPRIEILLFSPSGLSEKSYTKRFDFVPSSAFHSARRRHKIGGWVWYKTPLNWYKSVGEKTSQIPTDFDIIGWNFERFVYNKYTENVGSPDLTFTHRFVIGVHCCLGAAGGWLVHRKCPPVFMMSDSQVPTEFFRKTLNIHCFIGVSRCCLILP